MQTSWSWPVAIFNHSCHVSFIQVDYLIVLVLTKPYCFHSSFKFILDRSIGWWKSLQQYMFSSVPHSCPTLCDPMDCSMPGQPVHHQLPEFTQTHAHQVGDAIQPSHPLSSPSPAPNPSQHQGLFKWVTSHQVAKVLEFQCQHQSFQWTARADLL